MPKTDPESPPLTPLSYEILLSMADGPLHGYGVIKAVSARTDGAVEIEAGTLYAAIKRLREEGLLELAGAPKGASGDSRRRYYRMTPAGRRSLRVTSERLARLVAEARAKKILPEGSW